MTEIQRSEKDQGEAKARGVRKTALAGKDRPRLWTIGICVAALFVIGGITTLWLGAKAATIKSELEASTQLIPELKESVLQNRPADASSIADQLQHHTSTAREAASDPLWSLASALPWLGANFSAATEIARSADDVATQGVAPLVKVYDSVNWDKLVPSASGTNLEPLRKAAPAVTSAAHAVRASSERLNAIDNGSLIPQIAAPLKQAQEQLSSVVDELDSAADAASLAPVMLGADQTRHYLLLVQNNAEARATGGIPGALAVLTADKGKLSLTAESSATALGRFDPPVPVDEEQQRIYSTRMGMFMQDVNFTPDFPTAATTALKMWEQKKGEHLDGAISIDPVALGYILDATGPISLHDPQLAALTAGKLPNQLSGKNVVKTLLSDVYAQIEDPKVQDVYFAAVAKEIFGALSSGKGEAKSLLAGVGKGVDEHRVLLWSSDANEQSVLGKYPFSGSISGPSVPAAQFGAYFNDGTGAKMDYYVKSTVQLFTQCPVAGYGTVKMRITSTNTAPTDAATSLPSYVTGAGAYGVPAGTAQTNLIAYGPAQSQIETATQDGNNVPFGAGQHDNRPVGTLSVRLAPGQSSVVEFTFGKIVQQGQPEVVVTPSVESMDKVILQTQSESCGAVK
ncbi:DUF4012 domain-containing protein [Arthrobacter bambusae]|uniref:DUF4012 domain-containing protein n=1 Tax=Arthrobacter bambusae TaxID=1338426 RepID=UPI002780EC20|nr:DUF4012 domain-containing protein [Arthrobacter bambusae]MDQ0031434.1 hypothetical protein [Arthrobacter bambusae]MDQ0099677.1 hypothetical protein [Arthrobacter bambusae]